MLLPLRMPSGPLLPQGQPQPGPCRLVLVRQCGRRQPRQTPGGRRRRRRLQLRPCSVRPTVDAARSWRNETLRACSSRREHSMYVAVILWRGRKRERERVRACPTGGPKSYIVVCTKQAHAQTPEDVARAAEHRRVAAAHDGVVPSAAAAANARGRSFTFATQRRTVPSWRAGM